MNISVLLNVIFSLFLMGARVISANESKDLDSDSINDGKIISSPDVNKKFKSDEGKIECFNGPNFPASSWCKSLEKCITDREECPEGDENESKTVDDIECGNGEVWCDSASKCIDPMVQDCQNFLFNHEFWKLLKEEELRQLKKVKEDTQDTKNNEIDEYGCNSDLGEVWCKNMSKCIDPLVEDCPNFLFNHEFWRLLMVEQSKMTKEQRGNTFL